MKQERSPEQQADFQKLVDSLWEYANKWTPNRDTNGEGIDTGWMIGLIASLWSASSIPIEMPMLLSFQLVLGDIKRANETCNCEGCQKNRKAAAQREFDEISRNLNNPSVN